MRLRLAGLFAAVVALLAPPGAVLEARGDAIAVVVGRQSRISDVTLDVLREVYLRRRRLWPDGARVIPVNLPVDSDARQRFSKRVLGRLPEDLGGYWNRLYFDGIQPPLVLRTPEAVCAYLAVEPRAIGYLPQGYVDEAACRIVLVLPD